MDRQRLPGQPGVFLLDGAMGTQLMDWGLKPGELPEEFIEKNRERTVSLLRAYIAAGSRAVLAPTFNLNRITLQKHGREGRLLELNRAMVELSREAADGQAAVGGDLSGVMALSHPIEETDFEELVACYKEQVGALLDAGVDFFFLETFVSLEEAKAALLAVKESCELPVYVCMSVDDEGRTFCGVSALCALLTMQALGADGFGLNCSTGPADMYAALKEIKPYAKIPLIAKPNTGVVEKDGTGTLCGPEEFAEWGRKLARLGVKFLGGCCGTGPEYMEKLREAVDGIEIGPPEPQNDPELILVAAAQDAHFLGLEFDMSEPISCDAYMGETIVEKEDEGYSVLRVELSDREDVVHLLRNLYMIRKPLCIQTHSYVLLEAAARAYPGQLLFLDEYKLEEAVEPLIQKYGLIVVGV